jgi:putative copper resistance protein D
VLRVGGFALALVQTVVLLGRPATARHPLAGVLSVTVSLAAAGLLAYSFTLTGHSANLGWPGAVAIVLHVSAVFWWLGSLYPLWMLCRERSPTDVFSIMDDFGRLATPFVVTVIVAGAVLAYLLLQSPAELVATAYGRALALKLLLVTALLAYAARHKWQLTPGLLQGDSAARLQRSIAWEGGVAFLVLLITASLSTLLGPAMFSS